MTNFAQKNETENWENHNKNSKKLPFACELLSSSVVEQPVFCCCWTTKFSLAGCLLTVRGRNCCFSFGESTRFGGGTIGALNESTGGLSPSFEASLSFLNISSPSSSLLSASPPVRLCTKNIMLQLGYLC